MNSPIIPPSVRESPQLQSGDLKLELCLQTLLGVVAEAHRTAGSALEDTTPILQAVAQRLQGLAQNRLGSEVALLETTAANIESLTSTVSGGPRLTILLPTRVRPAVQVTPDKFVEAFLQDPGLVDFTRPSYARFGSDQKDDLRLIASKICFLNEAHVKGFWNPSVTDRFLDDRFREIANEDSARFREVVIKRLKIIFSEKVILTVGACAIARSRSNSNSSSAENIGSLIERIALHRSDQDVSCALSSLAEKLSIENEGLIQFVDSVLKDSSRAVFDLLRIYLQPFHKGFGDKLEKTMEYLNPETSYRKIGSKGNMTGEAVRLAIQKVCAFHPLIGSIIHSHRKNDLMEENTSNAQLQLHENFVSELLAGIRADPEAFYREAQNLDSSPNRGIAESDQDYFKRVFLCAFAGKYGRNGKPLYPQALRILSSALQEYFRDLVYEIVRDRLESGLKSYVNNLTQGEGQDGKLFSIMSDDPEKYQNEEEFLKALVDTPTLSVKYLATKFCISENRGKEIAGVARDLLIELARARAEEVCAVFEADWCKPWLLGHWDSFIRARLFEQKSGNETAVQLGISLDNTYAIYNKLKTHFPILGRFLPRLIQHKPELNQARPIAE